MTAKAKPLKELTNAEFVAFMRESVNGMDSITDEEWAAHKQARKDARRKYAEEHPE